MSHMLLIQLLSSNNARTNTYIYIYKCFLNVFHRNTFVTDLFADDIAKDIGNNALLAVDLGQLTIRSDTGEKTFEQLISMFSFVLLIRYLYKIVFQMNWIKIHHD